MCSILLCTCMELKCGVYFTKMREFLNRADSSLFSCSWWHRSVSCGQFYTESFAFVTMGSMYRLATTDTDPSTIHSPVCFVTRHCLCSGPCHASRCCQGCIAVEYILQRRQFTQHIRSISGALTMEIICNLSSPWRTAASRMMLY